jgi:hypothetical protein
MNTERHSRWARSNRVGTAVIPGDVHDVAVMVAVTAPAGCNGLAGHQACLPTRWRSVTDGDSSTGAWHAISAVLAQVVTARRSWPWRADPDNLRAHASARQAEPVLGHADVRALPKHQPVRPLHQVKRGCPSSISQLKLQSPTPASTSPPNLFHNLRAAESVRRIRAPARGAGRRTQWA